MDSRHDNTLLIVLPAGLPRGQAACDAVIAQWPADHKPAVHTLTAAQLLAEPARLRSATAVWVRLHDQPFNSELYELIGLLQDQHAPTLLTSRHDVCLGGRFQDGVVTAPSDTPPAMLFAMLTALMSQCGALRTMRAETELLRLHQGGLCDQMDKLDEELRMAAQLQRDMLPATLPSLPNVGFRVLFRPAGYVSGDIYDVTVVDDQYVSFFLADAVGHGVPAALMTVYIKRSLSSMQTGATRSPDAGPVAPNEALGWLNAEMLRQQSRKVRFATACYGLLNTRTLELQLSRAGHPFPLLLHGGGKFEWLDPEGGLLGVFPDEAYELRRIQLTPGDRLLLYSDGFETAFPQDNAQRLTTDRYTQEFHALADCPMDQAMQRLADRLDEQAGSLHQVDDLTALMMQVGSKPESRTA